MAEDWTNIEVELIVSDYLSMLDDELKGKSINKSQHRKDLIKLLNGRSDGSIEFKHQNISAVLIKLGLPYIKGYKPRWNYQKVLEDRTIKLLAIEKSRLEPTFIEFAENNIQTLPKNINFSELLDSAPDRSMARESEIKYFRKPIKVNYLGREQKNLTLGKNGEMFVLEFEKWRLKQEGNESLISKIEWVAQVDDTAGFDIISKNIDGSDRYIEVKTTKLNKDTPIFFSRNELEFSKQKGSDFHLYRLFNFGQSPRMFNLNGDFDTFCRKEAINYKGYF